jgi:hypothetical protein
MPITGIPDAAHVIHGGDGVTVDGYQGSLPSNIGKLKQGGICRHSISTITSLRRMKGGVQGGL